THIVLDLRVGQEVPIGASAGASKIVQSSRARMGMDEKGLYIIEDSVVDPYRRGTFVNHQRLESGEKVYVRSTDQVTIGDPSYIIPSWPQGESLFTMPKEIRTVPRDFRPADPVEFQRAIKQSNDYVRLHQISEHLEDGWQNAGMRQVFDVNGRFAR